MRTIILAAGAAALTLSAGAAFAAGPKDRTTTGVGPKQPIPYSQLDAYGKASANQRATRDWWANSATEAGVNASTTVNPAGDERPSPAGAPTAPMGDPLAVNRSAAPGDGAAAGTGATTTPPR